MFHQTNDLQNTAFFTLTMGALGDWLSTKIGLFLGFNEGNQIAASLMNNGTWLQVDLVLVILCFTIPFLVSRFSDEKAPQSLYWFPFVAGLLKLGVSIWNLSIILI